MKTMNYTMRVMMMVMVAMMSTATMAKDRGHNNNIDRRGTRHEMVVNHNKGGHMVIKHDASRHDYRRWEGRVRHMSDGRWGYYRDNRWYYYNTYIAPEYYYAHPVAHFHHYHVGPVAGAIAATATIAILAAALAH